MNLRKKKFSTTVVSFFGQEFHDDALLDYAQKQINKIKNLIDLSIEFSEAPYALQIRNNFKKAFAALQRFQQFLLSGNASTDIRLRYKKLKTELKGLAKKYG